MNEKHDEEDVMFCLSMDKFLLVSTFIYFIYCQHSSFEKQPYVLFFTVEYATFFFHISESSLHHSRPTERHGHLQVYHAFQVSIAGIQKMFHKSFDIALTGWPSKLMSNDSCDKAASKVAPA